jgi:hypothetical protein
MTPVFDRAETVHTLDSAATVIRGGTAYVILLCLHPYRPNTCCWPLAAQQKNKHILLNVAIHSIVPDTVSILRILKYRSTAGHFWITP